MVDGPLLAQLNLHEDELHLLHDNEDEPSSALATGFEPSVTTVAVQGKHQRTRSTVRSSERGLSVSDGQAIELTNMFSPRTPTYDRLETGMGGRKKNVNSGFLMSKLGYLLSGWRRVVVIILVLITFIALINRRPHNAAPWQSTSDSPPISTKRPLMTYEKDPDRLHTTFCKNPHSSAANHHIVQYALVIDAGSTGSRIHIYKFNNCKAAPSYEYEVFKQLRPGLSSYAHNPTAAAESLDPLLEEAMEVVPKKLWKCTPVAVKATAGLRLLGMDASTAILKAVEHRLRNDFPFPLPEHDSVITISGKDEAVYAWITANYLLETILPSTPPQSPSYAVLDLGGASTQIVFMPEAAGSDPPMVEGDHRYELNFGGKKFNLYQHSYLGYGLMQARESVHHLVEFVSSFRGRKDGPMANPCLWLGSSRNVNVSKEHTVPMTGVDVGSYDGCRRIMDVIIDKDAPCPVKPCSFGSTYQPSIMTAFPEKTGKVLLLSYFYDRIAPLVTPSKGHAMGSSPADFLSITISTLKSLSQIVCSGPAAWHSDPHISASPSVLEELDGRPEWCLDLVFMYTLLTEGYGFRDTRTVWLGKKLEGTELGWAFGAGIGLVNGEGTLKCRA